MTNLKTTPALLFALVLSSLFTGSARADYVSAVLADNPIAYWRLGDGGATYADATGNGHAGGDSAGTVTHVSGLLPSNPSSDGAVLLGGNERITVPGFEKIGAGGYSAEYWVNFSSLPNNCCVNVLGDGESGGDFFMMNYVLGPNQGLTGAVRPHFSPANPPVAIASPIALQVNQTYHVVTTWDTSLATNNAKIYFNGSLVGQGTVANNVPVPGTTGNNQVYMGRDDRSGAEGSFVLDEPALYNYALTAGQVLTHAVYGGIARPSVVLSTGVLGPGTYGDGYNNNAGNSTVELVRFIPNSDASPLNVDYNQNGDKIDLSNYVVAGATAGVLGSDIHGRGAQLFLPGDGETSVSNHGGIGLGAHANWLITFDLNDIRTAHFFGATAPFLLTGRFGMNGQGSPGEPVQAGGLVEGLIYLDGQQIFASNLKSILDGSDPISLTITSGRWLTLAIVNGNDSSFFDDGTFRDMTLTMVPEPASIALFGMGALGYLRLRQRTGRKSSRIPNRV